MPHPRPGRSQLGRHYFFDSSQRRFRVFAAEDYDEGDQVFICYGLRTNAELAMGYGMAIPRNPVDFVKVPNRIASRPLLFLARRRGDTSPPSRAQYSAEPHADDPVARRKVALLHRVGYGLCVASCWWQRTRRGLLPD